MPTPYRVQVCCVRPSKRGLAAFFACVAFAAWLVPVELTRAQGRGIDLGSSLHPDAPRGAKTEVVVELLAGKEGVGYRAQQWRAVFEKLDISLTVRQAVPTDKIETREYSQGPLRNVTAVGKLERDGRISFIDREFSLVDTDKLAEWIENLQKYGAQGSPEGKPIWGLSDQQFATLYGALSTPINVEVEGMELDAALARMELPEPYPLRFKNRSRERIENEHGRSTVRQSLKGTAKGTVLAIILSEHGLGYWPERTPRGTIELAVEPVDNGRQLWPTGWEFSDVRRRNERAARLFKLVPVELEPIALKQVLDAVSLKADTPIFYDYYRIEARGIDVRHVQVSQPRRQMSYSQLIHSVVNQAKLTRRIVRDERDTPFVWITTLDPKRLEP